MKLCGHCKTEKSFDQFHKSRQTKTGYSSWCKSCACKKVKEYNSRPGSRDKKSEYDRKRHIELGDEKRAYQKDNYSRFRDSKIAYAVKWNRENPSKRRSITQAYKSRRRSVERDGMTGVELGAWVKGRKKKCHWCGVGCADKFHVDHVMPLSKGGAHEKWNLAISCQPCNSRKADKHPLDWLAELGYAP